MIHIDIYVPSMGESFEFCCDETVPVYEIRRDIYSLLSAKAGADLTKEAPDESSDRTKLWLCDMEGRCVLSPDRSLTDQNIRHGSRLILL